VEKTRVSKADSDEKSHGFPEKSRGNFQRFPYGTSAEKVSHIFPEKFPGNFPDRSFPEIPGISEKLADIFYEKSFPQFF
tara:strand:+ start:44 stop:280 length:237 start_codon:yes stop_codon:yes gene_type:complete